MNEDRLRLFLKGKDGENAFFYNVNNLKQSPETCH